MKRLRGKEPGFIDVSRACRKWLRKRDLMSNPRDWRFSQKAKPRRQLEEKRLTRSDLISNPPV